jgi:uncharacterized protein
VQVQVSDVRKWAGREESAVMEPPWPADLAGRLDWPLTGEPTGTVTVRNMGESLLVEVEGEALVQAECGRCLTSFPLRLHFQDSQEYRLAAPGPEDDWKAYAGDHIDLDDLVTDAIVLAEPLAPVCRPDCRGLCPQCGQDWNQGPCACESPVDQRWAALEGFTPKRPDTD